VVGKDGEKLFKMNVGQVGLRESKEMRDRFVEFNKVTDALEDALKWAIPKVW
jgi:hypothetical protein